MMKNIIMILSSGVLLAACQKPPVEDCWKAPAPDRVGRIVKNVVVNTILADTGLEQKPALEKEVREFFDSKVSVKISDAFVKAHDSEVDSYTCGAQATVTYDDAEAKSVSETRVIEFSIYRSERRAIYFADGPDIYNLAKAVDEQFISAQKSRPVQRQPVSPIQHEDFRLVP